MSKRRRKTSLARIRNNDWVGELGMERNKSKPTHSTIELHGIKIGRRRNGIVRYMLYNRKSEPLRLEILHLLHNKEFILKKGKRIEAINDGYGLLQKWREKGIVNSEGAIQDIQVDLLKQGERIFI